MFLSLHQTFTSLKVFKANGNFHSGRLCNNLCSV